MIKDIAFLDAIDGKLKTSISFLPRDMKKLIRIRSRDNTGCLQEQKRI